MVRASGYKSRGPGFDSRLYHGDFPCGGRISVVTMVWVVSRIRFKLETSLTRSHTSINSWLNPRQRSPRWRGPHHERQPAHQLIEHPSILIADYGRKHFLVLWWLELRFNKLPLNVGRTTDSIRDAIFIILWNPNILVNVRSGNSSVPASPNERFVCIAKMNAIMFR